MTKNNKICDKAEGCKSSCWHKEEHESIIECEFPCPANSSAICIELYPTKANP